MVAKLSRGFACSDLSLEFIERCLYQAFVLVVRCYHLEFMHDGSTTSFIDLLGIYWSAI